MLRVYLVGIVPRTGGKIDRFTYIIAIRGVHSVYRAQILIIFCACVCADAVSTATN